MQTASGTAESDVSGVYMNMVTKSGGNRFNSDHNFYFMNDALQGNNVDDELRQRLGLGAGAADRRRRQSDRHLLRLELDARRSDQARQAPGSSARCGGGGSISSRSARSTPDGSQAIDDNRIENYMGKATWQVGAEHARVVHVQPQPEGPVPSPRRAVPLRRGQGDGAAGSAGAELRRAAQPGDRAADRVRRALRPDVGRVPDPLPEGSDAERHRRSRHRAQHAHQRRREQSLNPNHRYQAQRHARLLRRQPRRRLARLQGRHAAVVGADGVRPHPQRRHPARAASTASSTRAVLSNTPINSDHRLETWARLRAGSLDDRPRHDQLRRPHRRRQGYLPAQSSPAGTLVGERDRSRRRDVFDFSPNVAPRLGITLRPLRQRPHGAQGVLRPVLQPVRIGARRSRRIRTRASTCRCRGPIRNNNLRARSGRVESRRPSRDSPPLFPPMDPDARRPVQRRDSTSASIIS